MSDLRERLLGQSFAPDDDALFVHVDTAVAVVAEWLREHARDLAAANLAETDFDTQSWIRAQHHIVSALADALTQKEPTP